MTDSDLIAQVQVILPKYLTPAQQADLWQEIRSFPRNESFYLPEGTIEEDLLQGDGWRGLMAVNVDTLEKKAVSGLLVSNSCDIDLRNDRAVLPNLLFAPLVPLSRLEEIYRMAGKSGEQWASFLEAVRRQEKTNIFYLPPGRHGPDEEFIILFDDIHRQPVHSFIESARSLVFRLNQIAFWTLLIKLSIHFARFNEDVARFPLDHAS